jgi:hypothetical protein
MYLEFDWAFMVFRPRLGDGFISIRDHRSFATMDEAKRVLGRCGLRVGKKTDTRTWRIQNTGRVG